jgi:hypothetical protein
MGVGQRAFLSYNRHTGATPQSAYVTGYAKLLGGLREIYGDGLLLNEGINDLVDRYGDGAYTWNQSQDPAVLAYSVPWTAFSNDVEALDYAAVNTAFVHKMLANLVVDGGAGTVDEYPEFAAHLQALQALEAATREYYGEAEFRDHDGLKSIASDTGIVTAVFVHPTRAASSAACATRRGDLQCRGRISAVGRCARIHAVCPLLLSSRERLFLRRPSGREHLRDERDQLLG